MSLSLKTEAFKKYTKEEALTIVSEYAKEQVDLSLRKMRSEERFEKPSWSEYQSFQLGMQKAFEKIIEFIPDQENINV